MNLNYNYYTLISLITTLIFIDFTPSPKLQISALKFNTKLESDPKPPYLAFSVEESTSFHNLLRSFNTINYNQLENHCFSLLPSGPFMSKLDGILVQVQVSSSTSSKSSDLESTCRPMIVSSNNMNTVSMAINGFADATREEMGSWKRVYSLLRRNILRDKNLNQRNQNVMSTLSSEIPWTEVKRWPLWSKKYAEGASFDVKTEYAAEFLEFSGSFQSFPEMSKEKGQKLRGRMPAEEEMFEKVRGFFGISLPVILNLEESPRQDFITKEHCEAELKRLESVLNLSGPSPRKIIAHPLVSRLHQPCDLLIRNWFIDMYRLAVITGFMVTIEAKMLIEEEKSCTNSSPESQTSMSESCFAFVTRYGGSCCNSSSSTSGYSRDFGATASSSSRHTVTGSPKTEGPSSEVLTNAEPPKNDYNAFLIQEVVLEVLDFIDKKYDIIGVNWSQCTDLIFKEDHDSTTTTGTRTINNMSFPDLFFCQVTNSLKNWSQSVRHRFTNEFNPAFITNLSHALTVLTNYNYDQFRHFRFGRKNSQTVKYLLDGNNEMFVPFCPLKGGLVAFLLGPDVKRYRNQVAKEDYERMVLSKRSRSTYSSDEYEELKEIPVLEDPKNDPFVAVYKQEWATAVGRSLGPMITEVQEESPSTISFAPSSEAEWKEINRQKRMTEITSNESDVEKFSLLHVLKASLLDAEKDGEKFRSKLLQKLREKRLERRRKVLEGKL